MTHARTRRTVSALAILAFALGTTGCAMADKNKGGDTTCGDYLSMTSKEQTETIKKFLADKGDSDPSGMDVNLSKGSAKLYCNTVGSDSDPIRKIDTG